MERIIYSVIIPSYNEEGNVEILLESFDSIIPQHLEVIIVDNGSDKRVADYVNTANRPWLRVIRTEMNLGYGGGIKFGLSCSRGSVLCWTHGDGQVPPEKVIEILVNKFPVDEEVLLKGKRINRNPLDRAFSKCMEYWVRFKLGVSLTEINAQPKIFSRVFYESSMKDCPSDFSLDLYLLLQAKRNSIKIHEFPIDFNDRVHGNAKGGGSIRGKISLIKRTLYYINNLK